MRNKKTSLKSLKTEKKSHKAGIAVWGVTALFAVLGAVFMIIGYHDEFLRWMVTTGIAFLVIAAIPLLIFGYNLIQKKIDS